MANTQNNIVNRLHKYMVNLRKLTPVNNEDNSVSKGSETWEGFMDGYEIERVIIYLKSSGCSWVINKNRSGDIKLKPGCLDCEHSLSGTTFGKAISADSYFIQFITEFTKYDYCKYPSLSIFNEGNFFNPDELPVNARRRILKQVGDENNIKVLILESLPKYITDECLHETKSLIGNTKLEIGVGLESSNKLIRKLCINKPYDLNSFEKMLDITHRHGKSLAYIMLKPAFLNEQESISDCISTIRYAFAKGVNIVSIEPVNASNYNMSGALKKKNMHRVPWLWSVIEVIRQTNNLGEIRIGGLQFSPSYSNTASNCSKCDKKFNEAIRLFNRSYNVDVFKTLQCECKSEWLGEQNITTVSLEERILVALDKLEDSRLNTIINR